MFPHTFNISLSVSTYSCCSHRMLQFMPEFLLHPLFFFFVFSSHCRLILRYYNNRYLSQFYVPVAAPYFPKFSASYATDKFWLLYPSTFALSDPTTKKPAYIYIYIYIYVCVCVCVYMYIYIYIYICTHTPIFIPLVYYLTPFYKYLCSFPSKYRVFPPYQQKTSRLLNQYDCKNSNVLLYFVLRSGK